MDDFHACSAKSIIQSLNIKVIMLSGLLLTERKLFLTLAINQTEVQTFTLLYSRYIPFIQSIGFVYILNKHYSLPRFV